MLCSSSKIDIYLRRRKQKFLRLEVKKGIYMKRRLHSEAILERPDTKDSFSKHSESVFELPIIDFFDARSFVGVDYFVVEMTLWIQRSNVKHLLCLCFSIFSLWTEYPITNATTDEPKGLILTSLEKVHYVQNKDHEKQLFSKMLTLPATSCNILCDFGTRPHF